MRKALRCTITLFLSIVCLALLAPSLKVKAQNIGVSPGQYFTYGTSDGSPWVIMNPSDAPPLQTWVTYENFSTLNFTVTSVRAVPDTITFNETIKFRNGTRFGPFVGGFDVYTGSGGGVFFISPGLNPDTLIYPGNTNSSYAINETYTDHTYWSGREVCFLNYTTANPLENKSSALAARRTLIYWDYATGVLLSAFEEAGAYDPTTQAYVEGSLLIELIANNALIPTDYPSPINWTPVYVVVAIIAIVVVAFVVVRTTVAKPKKKHKRLKQ